jgi:hypothetical protein
MGDIGVNGMVTLICSVEEEEEEEEDVMVWNRLNCLRIGSIGALL